MAKLQLPLDSNTVDGLRALGKDLVKKPAVRKAFTGNPAAVLKKYNITGLDPAKFEPKLVDLLTDTKFERAVRTKDVDGIRAYVQDKLGISAGALVAGTFDFDFDVEFEVEVVAVAIAVFDVAVVAATKPTSAQLAKRREIVAQAFQKLGKTVR